MPLEYDLIQLMIDTITIEPFLSEDQYGKPTYGAPYTAQCRVEKAKHLIREKESRELTQYATVYMADPTLVNTMSQKDQMAFADGSIQVITAFMVDQDDTGPYSFRILTFNKKGS
jgi:hypothetical protein